MNVQVRDPSADDLRSFVSSASFWTPELVVDSAWVEHTPFAFWIVEALRPASIVELGVHHGFSYFVFCQAVRRLRLQTRCFAIDTWQGDEHAGFYGDDVYDRVCQRNRPYDGFSRLIRSTFSDACEQFADGSIDLLHIDGRHSYDAVRRDFETWLPKLSKHGVVLFHDTAEHGHGFGVCQLWDELRRRYPHFEFTHGHGLGIAGVGENIPARVRRLFAASSGASSSQPIRAAYQRLGGSIEHLRKLTNAGSEAARLSEQVRSLEAVIGSYERSTSWRLTAPLRMMATILKSAHGRGRQLAAALLGLAHISAHGAKDYHATRCTTSTLR